VVLRVTGKKKLRVFTLPTDDRRVEGGRSRRWSLEMKHAAIKWPHFHMPEQAHNKWIYALVAAVVLAALIAVGWYAGLGGFGE